MNWLEYSKMILQKVSFSRELFRKELRKSLKKLDMNQRNELILWCRDSFKTSEIIFIKTI